MIIVTINNLIIIAVVIVLRFELLVKNKRKRGTMKNSEFGKRLRELRKSRGYTQQCLAEKAEIDEKHLSRVENGKYFPSYATLNKLLTALGVTLDEVGIELNKQK